MFKFLKLDKLFNQTKIHPLDDNNIDMDTFTAQIINCPLEKTRSSSENYIIGSNIIANRISRKTSEISSELADRVESLKDMSSMSDTAKISENKPIFEYYTEHQSSVTLEQAENHIKKYSKVLSEINSSEESLKSKSLPNVDS